MGLLFDYTKSMKPVTEAEVDGESMDDSAQATDYTDDASSNDQQPPAEDGANNDQGVEENNDQENQDPNPEDQGGDNEPTDYTAETDDGGDMPPEDGEGDNDEGNQGGGDNQQSEEEVDDLKAKEEELYANLTPDQLDIKHKELKGQFLSMFDMVSELVERMGDTGTTEENIKIVEYISNNLINLKDMISDYVNDVYQTKSYIENSIMYNRFLATLNAINQLLEEIQPKDN